MFGDDGCNCACNIPPSKPFKYKERSYGGSVILGGKPLSPEAKEVMFDDLAKRTAHHGQKLRRVPMLGKRVNKQEFSTMMKAGQWVKKVARKDCGVATDRSWYHPADLSMVASDHATLYDDCLFKNIRLGISIKDRPRIYSDEVPRLDGMLKMDIISRLPQDKALELPILSEEFRNEERLEQWKIRVFTENMLSVRKTDGLLKFNQ